MKNKLSAALFAALVALAFCSCRPKSEKQSDMVKPDSTLTEEEIEAGVLTPEVMWKLGRVGSSEVSPDGGKVVYTVTRYNMAENKGITCLYLTDLEKLGTVQLTEGSAADSDPSWDADGGAIYFLSDRSGDTQLWKFTVEAGRDGLSDPVRVTDVKDGIEGYKVAPYTGNLVYIKRVKVDGKNSSDKYPDLDKSQAKIYDGLTVRHWDRWEDGSHLHIFVSKMGEGMVTEGTDIMDGEAWDAPMAPYFDMDEIAWNNQGTQVAYTCKKLQGTQYALSTDSDIYVYDTESNTTRNLTQGMPGYDKYPRFSPDDQHLAFTSMRRAGNESDKERLMVIHLADGNMEELVPAFDYSAQNVRWDDNTSLFFISPMEGTNRLCRVSLDDKEVAVTLYGEFDVNRFTWNGGTMVAEIVSLSAPAELFRVDPYGGQTSQFTTVNAGILNHIKMGQTYRRMVRTTDNKQMLVRVVTPPDFDERKKYPVLLFCEGGPQSTVSQFWSYRWNFQLMAAQGYVVVAPNRRGCPSFGQEWLDQISGDYSGQNIRDYLSAIDDVLREPWADASRVGCVGASYGGYSVFFLAGCHQKRFKAFIAHCGMFNLESMYGATEELWFPNNDLGGPYWSDDATARRSYANSPHRFVKNWDTPMLIITGANDFRIPYTESLQAFTAAQLRGIPSRLVFFENEAHQVFKPQNSLAWNREFFSWLDQWVKDPE